MLFKLRMGSRAKHLNTKQRLAGFAFDLRQLVQVPLALSYIIIPFVLLSGSPLVFWTTAIQLKVLIRLVSVWTACHWLHNGVMGAIAGTGNEFTQYDVRMASYDSEMEQWMSPCESSIIMRLSDTNSTLILTVTDYFVAFMRSFILPVAFGGVTMGFKTSGSNFSDLQERDPRNRAPLLRRLRVTLFHHHAVVHVIFVSACVVLNFARAFSLTNIPNLWDTFILSTALDKITFLVTRLGWPPLF
jgi:hypothetical protein